MVDREYSLDDECDGYRKASEMKHYFYQTYFSTDFKRILFLTKSCDYEKWLKENPKLLKNVKIINKKQIL